MSSFRTNRPGSACCYIPWRHRGFYKDQLRQLNVFDDVMREMEGTCECHKGSEDDNLSSPDSSFHCPCILERDGYKYLHGQASSSLPLTTTNTSDFDIHWPEDLPSKWKSRSLRCGPTGNKKLETDEVKPRKTVFYTVFH